MLEEPVSDDLIRPPMKVNGPALPGAQEGKPTSLKGREGIVGPRSGHPPADDDGTRFGPVVEHCGTGGLAAMVG